VRRDAKASVRHFSHGNAPHRASQIRKTAAIVAETAEQATPKNGRKAPTRFDTPTYC
jgi:hypothetical protein